MIPARLGFEAVSVMYLAGPVLLGLIWLSERRLRRDLVPARRRAALLALRGLGLATLLALLARPVVLSGGASGGRRTVMLLVDSSRSMGLADEGVARYQQALERARGLVPALDREGFRPRTLAFDAATAPLSLASAGEAPPQGELTDLAGAFRDAVLSVEPPPAALVVLTDGAANRAEGNSSALLTLLETRTPVFAIGFGRDAGVPSLSLRRLLAPARVPPRQAFRVSAQLQSAGGPLPEFDLLLLRDGALVQSRHVASDGGGTGRVWSEGFDVLEAEQGLHEYAVQLSLPPAARLVSVNTRSSVPVRVGQDKDFRILYVQGALTWDFKFINRALRGDPTVRVTGLSRTSQQSVFRQNLETAGELASGFPQQLSEMAPYRVLVLSELRPGDLSPAQQELVARFCSELGGGVLVIGGQGTFDESWRGSRLEQLLPVTLDAGGVRGLDRPFHLRLTDEARRSPVFTVADDGSSARVWDGLPAFSGYGRILAEKPGATVFARHDQESSPAGKRVLVAAQPYGGGLAMVVAVQNLWRWRLAKESDPQAFDRFWQQLLRFLGQSGSQEFQIQFLDQELRTGADLRALVERRPRPEGPRDETAARCRLRVRRPDGTLALDQQTSLVPLRPAEIRFRAESAGTYTVVVEDAQGVPLASQPIEILDGDREMERTGRDMQNLRQWAAASEGLALTAEEAQDPAALARGLRVRVEALRARPARPQPVGIDAPVLAGLLACFAGEWALRRRWRLA